MTEPLEAAGLDGLNQKTAEAAAALKALEAPAQEAAGAIEEAFGRAGDSLARSLARAAADGELSLAELARALIAAVNVAAGGGAGGRSGLSDALAQAVGGVFGGSRAEGGLVSPGAAYLVGERGPEVFRPATAGEIGPQASSPVSVMVTVQGGPETLLRSEAQIAQALARAVRAGR